MIGCARCRAAVPLWARFCPRCGGAMDLAAASATVAPTPPAAPPAARKETAAEHEARVEAAVDRMLPRRQLEGLWFFVFVVGFVALSAGGVSKLVGLLIIVGSGYMLVRDVRRHVRVRERAEREVADRRHLS
jgi:hypothetical protein